MARRAAWERDQLESLKVQLRDVIGPHSPLWRKRFADLQRRASDIATIDELAEVPSIGERDVSPSGDPAGMASLVVTSGEAGFAMHADSPTVGRAIRARLSNRDEYRRIVDSEIRPTTFAWTGIGFDWPVAYTRGDLDVVARAGAVAWNRAGLTPDDALLAVASAQPRPVDISLSYAALAAGSPIVWTSAERHQLKLAARLMPPTAIAIPVGNHTDLLDDIAEGVEAMGATGTSRVRTIIFLGMPTKTERGQAIARFPEAAAIAWHVTSGGRLPWVECRGGAPTGLHIDPRFDLVQLVDPETGTPASSGAAGRTPREVVLTQLGLRGSAQLRWRTGDIVAGITTEPCPSCRAKAPRLIGAQSGALVARAGDHVIDLRAVTGALTGRPDIADWQVVTGGRRRDGTPQIVIQITPNSADDAAEAVVGLASDLRAAAGRQMTQIVVASPFEIAATEGSRTTTHIIKRAS